MPVQTDGPEDYKAKYKTLKRKLKLLIYENECFQEELRKAQRALLRVRRDKSFLLDRLLQYQRGPDSSTDSEQTEESDAEVDTKGDHKSCRKRLSMEGATAGSSSSQTPPSKPPSKKKKTSSGGGSGSGGGGGAGATSAGAGGGGGSSSAGKTSKQSGKQVSGMVGVGSSGSSGGGGAAGGVAQAGVATPSTNPTVRKLTPSHLAAASLHPQQGSQAAAAAAAAAAVAAAGGRRSMGPGGGGMGAGGMVAGHLSDGQLSREEVERRLAARQPLSDFTTTTVSLTLPNQLFSDNIMEGDFMEEEVETSPSNVEDDVTVDNYD